MKVSDKTGQRDEAFELCDGWGKFECSGLSNQWKQSMLKTPDGMIFICLSICCNSHEVVTTEKR